MGGFKTCQFFLVIIDPLSMPWLVDQGLHENTARHVAIQPHKLQSEIKWALWSFSVFLKMNKFRSSIFHNRSLKCAVFRDMGPICVGHRARLQSSRVFGFKLRTFMLWSIFAYFWLSSPFSLCSGEKYGVYRGLISFQLNFKHAIFQIKQSRKNSWFIMHSLLTIYSFMFQKSCHHGGLGS